MSGALVCIGVVVIALEFKPDRPKAITEAFYSTNDGKSWFIDDNDKMPPFDQNGQPAFRAFVFKASDGTQYVGYLERYTDWAKARLAELKSQPNPNPQAIMGVSQAGLQIKKPGDAKWVQQNSQAAADIMSASAPDGSVGIEVVP